MNQARTVKEVLKSKPVTEGAGVHLQRVFGYDQLPKFDPFLLLDDFGSEDPDDYIDGFPWHPHRGMETVTYMLSGEVGHRDSLGNKGVIKSGDVQWMTAGSGIVHEEMPQEHIGRMRGFQLWINLPAANKMTDPGYREIRAREIQTVRPTDGARVRVISGEADGVVGPVRDIVCNPLYLDVSLEPQVELEQPVDLGSTVFAYVFDGQGCFAGSRDLVSDGHLVLFDDGESVAAKAGDSDFRFLLIGGRPIGEKVAWYGPIVMNSDDEIRQAFDEFDKGIFVKTRPPAARQSSK